MNIQREKDRLSQGKLLADARRAVNPIQSLKVFQKAINNKRHHSVRSVFVNAAEIDSVFSQPSSPFLEPSGRFNWPRNVETTPLVLYRDFWGIREPYFEICEVFRLFHNLYDDRDGHLIKIFDDGNEERIATVDQSSGIVMIRMREILEFLAAKDTHLVTQIFCLEFSDRTLNDLGFAEDLREDRDGLTRWRFEYCNFDDPERKSFTRLKVLRVFEPKLHSLRRSPERYESFIISIDQVGEEIEHTCDPDQLKGPSNNNPDAPGFLTQVSFRKDVLDKYRSQPSKFRIEEGYLQCGGLWGIEFDDDHDDKVVVWLGDLGEKLPHSEQRYWRSFNFASETGVSKTYFQRQLMAAPVDSNRSEHRFRHKYEDLSRVSRENLGWDILLPLNDAERYLLQDVRVPVTDEQRDFDGLVLGLAKILVDSLNVKELRRLQNDDQLESVRKSIDVLEAVTSERGFHQADRHISFLRNVQSLRSSSAAHRKGSKYRKIAKKFGIEHHSSLRNVFAGILVQSIGFLDFLAELVTNPSFRQTPEE